MPFNGHIKDYCLYGWCKLSDTVMPNMTQWIFAVC